ncbi:MAG: hypothetical protein JXB19_00515 [Bacteroidales bacterium]|nr:hypothetical protein [Bacteroidales bacterium]
MKPLLIVILIYFLSFHVIQGQDPPIFQDSIPVIQDTILVDLGNDFELFDSEVPLQMNLTFDIQNFIGNKSDPEYLNARLNLFCEEDTVSWDIKIKARGEFRRNFCSFPPIMINVKGLEEGPTEIREQKTIKLVTHCRDAGEYEEYVFREYLLYKIYCLISPYSFNVRLVKINYIDENDPDDLISSYGFLIENIDHLADRNNAVEIDEGGLQQQDMIPEIMTRLAVFQYMIGNVDWQVGTHNVKVIQTAGQDTLKAIPLPYDFDHSGFVNADYAIPRKNLGLTDIRQRRYLGDCTLNGLISSVLDEFIILQEEFTNVINSFEFLNNSNKRDLLSYLSEFYKPLLEDQEKLRKELERACILILK